MKQLLKQDTFCSRFPWCLCFFTLLTAVSFPGFTDWPAPPSRPSSLSLSLSLSLTHSKDQAQSPPSQGKQETAACSPKQGFEPVTSGSRIQVLSPLSHAITVIRGKNSACVFIYIGACLTFVPTSSVMLYQTFFFFFFF